MISRRAMSISRVNFIPSNPLVVIQEDEATLKLPELVLGKHKDISPNLKISSLRKYSSIMQADDYLVSKNSTRTLIK